MHILLAEDDINIQSIVRQNLIELDYIVDVVNTGRAVYLLGSIPYDLIILDVRMSDWDGLTGIHMAKAFGNTSPVLVTTSDISVVPTSYYDVLYKPFTIKILLDKVNSMINEGYHESELLN